MPIVRTDVPVTAALCNTYIGEILRTYPFCRSQTLTTTVFQRSILTLVMGTGPRQVFYSAAHHANEWLTCTALLKFAEELARDFAAGDPEAAAVLNSTTIHMVPMVDPDGVDLVVGAIAPSSGQYLLARQLGENYPDIPFPNGWKANLLGVDLNLNYPAGWLQAREIKFSQGFILPGPRDFVGRAPLSQSETQAMVQYTQQIDPALVIALHSQGEEIYWQFKDIFVPGAQELGEEMARRSGYALADTPFNSSFAGFKDWFIQEYRRPGYTVEVGSGANPLPLAQFDTIYAATVPILLLGATGI